MANYLERVASSAGRRAAVAKPPTTGPPVLPAGRDFSNAPADPFVSDEEQFLETFETSAPGRVEERAKSPSSKPEVVDESKTTATHDETLAAPVEPEPKPRLSVERLSDESPFTVHLPRTLRPSATPKVPPIPADEAPRERTRVRASTTVGPEEFTIGEEPATVVHSTDTMEVKQSVTAEADTTSGPKPPVVAAAEEHQAPAPKPVHTEDARSNTQPIPRVDRVDGPPKFPAPSTEPSPPAALPVHLPPVAANTTRQEQSRINIGSLEVLVNNHPRVTTVRPAAAPSRTERLNLEKRYLDRFRLRH